MNNIILRIPIVICFIFGMLLISCEKNNFSQDAVIQLDEIYIKGITKNSNLLDIIVSINQALKDNSNYSLKYMLDDKVLNTTLIAASINKKEVDPFNPDLTEATDSQLDAMNYQSSLCDWLITIQHAYNVSAIRTKTNEIVIIPNLLNQNFGIPINDSCVNGKLIWQKVKHIKK